MVEFHPTSGMFNHDMIRDYPYSSGGVNMREEGGVRDYVALSFADSAEVQPDLKYTTGIQGFRNTNPCHEFCWGIADVVGSLAETGLHLKHLKEYPYSNFSKVFSTMTPELVEEGTRWRSEGPMLPLMYSVCFQKPMKA